MIAAAFRGRPTRRLEKLAEGDRKPLPGIQGRAHLVAAEQGARAGVKEKLGARELKPGAG